MAPKLKEICQTLDQKISNSQPGNIIVTQADLPTNFIRELALHLLNEFEDAEEKLKRVHKEIEELVGTDQLTDWRADGNFKTVAGMDAVNDGGLQAYLLHILIPKIVGMKAELAQKEAKVVDEMAKQLGQEQREKQNKLMMLIAPSPKQDYSKLAS